MANEEKKVEYLQFTTEDGSASELFKIPHTWRDVGAAPGGFGLGQETPVITEANEATYPGFYSLNGNNMDASSPSTPPGNLRFGSLLVTKRWSYIYQYASYANEAATRYSLDYGKNWSAWEWINPPMALNTEYRTTERYKGKPVYIKVISFGKKLPNNGTVNASWAPDSGEVETVIDARVIASSGTFIIERLSAGKNSIFITVPSNYSNYDAEVILKYTKIS